MTQLDNAVQAANTLTNDQLAQAAKETQAMTAPTTQSQRQALTARNGLTLETDLTIVREDIPTFQAKVGFVHLDRDDVQTLIKDLRSTGWEGQADELEYLLGDVGETR